MEMVREEPTVLYIYECIKRNKEDEHNYNVMDGQVFTTKEENLNAEFYKKIGTYRGAFVGDMQETLDKNMQCNNMERYAKSTPFSIGSRTTYIPMYTECDYSLKGMWKHFLNKFTEKKKTRIQKEKDDEYLEEQLFNKSRYDEAIISFNKKYNR